MQNKYHHIAAPVLSLFAVFTLLAVSSRSSIERSSPTYVYAWQASVGSSIAMIQKPQLHASVKTTMNQRIAMRLQRRLIKHMAAAPSVQSLSSAIDQRQHLLRNATTITILDPDGSERGSWDVSLNSYPSWLQLDFSLTSARFTINREEVLRTIEEELPVDILPVTDISIDEIVLRTDEDSVSRIISDTAGVVGEEINYEVAATTVATALESGLEVAEIHIDVKSPKIANATDVDLGSLDLIATGRSNFAGSAWGRDRNVRKALLEHVHNSLVAPGDDFSFNSTLEGPVALWNGWEMAKVIYNGGDLTLAPGGGICQASTTLYRAIVDAGFPVKDRRSHSLYVSYYKKYGVGIDAAIYPGSQDLVFTNDTDEHVLIQAYVDGSEAVVNFYGKDDGRTVDLKGPYFYGSAPDDLLVHGRAINPTEIVWLQDVHYADGRDESNTIVSRYKELPVSVRMQYAYDPSV